MGPGNLRPHVRGHSYGILLIFVVVAVPDAVTNVYVTLLRIKGEPHKAAAMNLAMAAVALGGAWFLMGSIGVAGAAWAWALSQAVGCVYVAVDALAGKRNRPPAPIPIGAERTDDRGPFVERWSMRRHYTAGGGNGDAPASEAEPAENRAASTPGSDNAYHLRVMAPDSMSTLSRLMTQIAERRLTWNTFALLPLSLRRQFLFTAHHRRIGHLRAPQDVQRKDQLANSP